MGRFLLLIPAKWIIRFARIGRIGTRFADAVDNLEENLSKIRDRYKEELNQEFK